MNNLINKLFFTIYLIFLKKSFPIERNGENHFKKRGLSIEINKVLESAMNKRKNIFYMKR